MRRRGVTQIVGPLVAAGLALAAPTMAWGAPGPAEYTFAFQDAQVDQAAKEVFGALGVNYTIDPSVTGRISFRIDRSLTKPQLLQAFEAALAANGVALVREGDSLTLTSRTKARTASGIRAVADQPRGGYEVVAVPLAYAVATEVAKALDAIAGKGAVIYSDDKLGLIILGGSGPELQSALDTIKVFDQSGLQASRIRWFELSQASAVSVAAELEGMLRAAKIGGVGVAPLKRLNGIILFGRTPAALDEVALWVNRLDAPMRDAASSLWIYRPRNTRAESLARTLTAVTGAHLTAEGPTTAPSSTVPRSVMPGTAAVDDSPPQQGPSTLTADDDGVRATFDKETNTLLISAPAWRWVQIQKVLAELDRPQGQLLIEASILEVSLTNDFRLGVDWSVVGASGRLNAVSTSGSTATIRPTLPGLSVTFLDTNIQAAVSALGARTTVEVVSAPKIITLDNHTARLQVGDQVPVVTQTSQGTSTAGAPLISTVDYRNSGVILSVTPRISGDDRIVVDVSQEVSSVVRTDTSGIDSPTIQQRQLSSTLVLSNGGVVALGGLISRTQNRGDRGVPFAKDIPGLGALFRTSSRNQTRTELIVLLSARIISDPVSVKSAMTDLMADMQELQARGLIHAP